MEGTDNDRYDITSSDQMEGFEHEEVLLTDYFNRRNYSKPDVEAQLAAFKAKHGLENNTTSRGTIVALLTAAAAVVLMFVVGNRHAAEVTDHRTAHITAYEAMDNIPSKILIDTNGKTTTVNHHNLIDYSKPVANNTVVYHTVKTPAQTTAEVELPDGTTVMLNACSQLRFPSTFTGGERKVEVKGEAYFKVSHNALMPFIVEANGITTKVTGTEFNVKANKFNSPAVTLVEGSVEVRPAGCSITPTKLKPGQHAELNNETLTVTDVDTYIYTAWTEDKFYFDNSTLLDIAKELGQWYNVSVVFDNPTKAKTRLFFTADRSDDIGDLIESLNMMKKAKLSFENNQIIIK